MTGGKAFLDVAMCFLWILTYTFVLIGTVKYRYPLISPITQAIIAPFEFSVLYFFVINGAHLSINYAFFAYVYWALIEFAIIVVMIKYRYIPRNHVFLFLLSLCVLTCMMCYLVGHKNQMFFFSYFNTFIGDIIWFFHIRRRRYPMKSLSLIVFIAKFFADIIAIPIYLGNGSWLINFICVALPILDLLFIITFFSARKPSMPIKSE